MRFFFISVIFASIVMLTPSYPMQNFSQTLPENFVYIDDIIPSVRLSPRYAENNNFVGKPIEGYNSKRLVLSIPAAEALKKAQEHFQKEGYSLVVYDAYRPQRAVHHFMRWSKDIDDQKMKNQYYPRMEKEKVFELGYVAEKSGHSRGSTLDVSIIPTGQLLHELNYSTRTLADGFDVPFLDDGTVDMGSSFDLFDIASHYESSLLITSEQQTCRRYLKEVLERYGFKNYAEEWWHFTLNNEPFKDTYFDFVVQ
jgi:D-alanyl-D-alanine dipeptidase